MSKTYKSRPWRITHYIWHRRPGCEPEIIPVMLYEGCAFQHEEWITLSTVDWTYNRRDGLKYIGESPPGEAYIECRTLWREKDLTAKVKTV